jgi:hypothetical protein
MIINLFGDSQCPTAVGEHGEAVWRLFSSYNPKQQPTYRYAGSSTIGIMGRKARHRSHWYELRKGSSYTVVRLSQDMSIFGKMSFTTRRDDVVVYGSVEAGGSLDMFEKHLRMLNSNSLLVCAYLLEKGYPNDLKQPSGVVDYTIYPNIELRKFTKHRDGKLKRVGLKATWNEGKKGSKPDAFLECGLTVRDGEYSWDGFDDVLVEHTKHVIDMHSKVEFVNGYKR